MKRARPLAPAPENVPSYTQKALALTKNLQLDVPWSMAPMKSLAPLLVAILFFADHVPHNGQHYITYTDIASSTIPLLIFITLASVSDVRTHVIILQEKQSDNIKKLNFNAGHAPLGTHTHTDFMQWLQPMVRSLTQRP